MIERPDPPINYFRSSTLWKALCWSWWWAIAICVIRALASFSLPPWLNRPVYVAAHFSKEASSDFSQNDSKSEHALAAQQRNLIRHRSVLDQVMEIGELRAAPSLSNPATSEAELRKRLQAQTGSRSKMMLISDEDADAEYAARICMRSPRSTCSHIRIRAIKDHRELQQWLNDGIRIWKLNMEYKRLEIPQGTRKPRT